MTLLEVGYVGKAHGLKGEVVIHLTTDRIEERTAPGAVFVCSGGPIDTLIVERARFQFRKANYEQWIVAFEGVAGREAAEALRGTALSAEPIEDDDVVFVHEVIGLRLVDQHGTDHGEIVSMLANPASDLLELGDGRLVPMVFLVEIDDTTATVEVPEGLL